MPTSQTFETLYKRLNSKQKEAVDAIDGPVMVIAGPGTGKTQILSLRIANILQKTDTSPDSILALTFTESGVYSMRKRLVDIIGSSAYKVKIHTFHGFANTVIQEYPDHFPRIIGSTHASDIEQIKIMEEIILDGKIKNLRPYGDPFYYLRPALGIIRQLKREGISPDAFEKLIKGQYKDFEKIPDLHHEKGAHKGKMKGVYIDLKNKILKNDELLIMYRAYSKALEKRKLYDYEDMIMEVITVLEKNSDLLLRLQETHQYILADEHQDANNAQNKILELLSSFHDHPNLFIVGDEKQAIFRFQGASLDNFLYFKKLYPDALIIRLEDNYRSRQGILDASHSMILKNNVPDPELRVRLISKSEQNRNEQEKLDKKNESEKNIVLHEFSKQQFEYMFLVSDIEEKIKSGVSPRQIAVIYRDNKDAFPIISYLEKTEIPFVVRSDQNVLADDNIRKLILLFRTITSLGEDALLVEALYIDFLKIEHLDIYKALARSRAEKISLYQVMRIEPKLTELHNKFNKWSKIVANTGLVNSFETIVREAGFLDYLLQNPGSVQKLGKLDVFFGEAKRLVENNKDARLKDFMQYLDILAKYNVLVKVGSQSFIEDSIELMTAHKSKGLEFEYVYIVGGYDTHWGNKRDVKHFHIPVKGMHSIGVDPIEDERRLFYVALTRAKQEVHVSFAREGANGEHQLPTQFIEEIDSGLIASVDMGGEEKKFGSDSRFLFSPKLQNEIGMEDREYLTKLFLDQGLSVSALNNYLRCPWDYFFNNLLRIPRALSKHQMYGTAIHEALKLFFKRFGEDKRPNKKTLLELFETALNKQPFIKAEHLESLERGKKALEGYFDTYHKTWSRNVVVEYNVAGVFVEVEQDEKIVPILLRGIIDKIEILPDGNINVVDYKTAAPKSRNEIMGLTKNGTGDYFRQLIFYKILLDKSKSGYDMKSGEIDFVEPDLKNKYKKEQFVIEEKDVESLLKTISNTALEILSFSFWNRGCDEKECEYCLLRKNLN